jgi:hypothetical protein
MDSKPLNITNISENFQTAPDTEDAPEKKEFL